MYIYHLVWSVNKYVNKVQNSCSVGEFLAFKYLFIDFATFYAI